MTTVPIRELSDGTVPRGDRSAEELGLPRNECLRPRLEGDEPRATVKATEEHWEQSAEILADA